MSKPCEQSQLEQVIERCVALQELLPTPALREIVGRVHRLSPNRATHHKLLSILASQTPNLGDMVELIASDTVIAAKVLQVTHSSFIHPVRPVASIKQAVDALGLERLRALLRSPEVFAHWAPKSANATIDLERLQAHVNDVAHIASALTLDMRIAGETLLAARLHEFGYWVLAEGCPRELTHAVDLARMGQIPLQQAERQTIGASHAEVGDYLLGLWGLPAAIVEAVAQHHAPEGTRGRTFDPAAALAVAIALTGTHDVDAVQGGARRSATVGPDYLQSLRAPFDWAEAQRRAAPCRGRVS